MTNDVPGRKKKREISPQGNLKPQIATSNSAWGGRRKLPYAFTEHGAIMAASVLNTPRAVEMSVIVVRAFVRLRTLLATHKELAGKVAELEKWLTTHDEDISTIVKAIKKLMAPQQPPARRQIGFKHDKE